MKARREPKRACDMRDLMRQEAFVDTFFGVFLRVLNNSLGTLL